MISPKRSQNSRPAKEMTWHMKRGKREFSCPFTWLKAIPWDKSDQPFGESLINIITPNESKKTQKEARRNKSKQMDPNLAHASTESGALNFRA